MGTAGHSLFILQLENNEYKDITYIVNFSLCKSFYILKHKTNGYRDIKLYGSISYNFKPFIVKYKNGLYKMTYRQEVWKELFASKTNI